MVAPSRYHISDKKAEVENDVLKNKLNLLNQQELEDAETALLADTYENFTNLLHAGKVRFSLDLIFDIHKYFLSTLYNFAGKIRTINISKEGVMFASALYINKALEDLKKIIRSNIPTDTDNKKQIAQKLAIIHNEFNVVHPFREGNGRTIRLFLDLLAISLGYEPIAYDVATKKVYLKACNAGIVQNHEPMGKIIFKGLKKFR